MPLIEPMPGRCFYVFAILCQVLRRLKIEISDADNSERLVRSGEALPGLFRVHIEKSATGSDPGIFLPLEHGAGVADVCDGGNVFHVTSCDRFKP